MPELAGTLASVAKCLLSVRQVYERCSKVRRLSIGDLLEARGKGFEVMRSLTKSRGSLFRYLPGVAGKVSLVHRAFDLA